MDRIADFCRRWKITEFSLFGSVLRDDFGPESDVDVLVTVEPGIVWDFDQWDAMQEELQALCGREVDLVPKQGLANPYRRAAILRGSRVVYAA